MNGKNIGFVGTRFAGTDGVSLESAKWANVLWEYEHISYWFAGKLDREPGQSYLCPHAYFGHEDITYINDRVFGRSTNRSKMITRQIYSLAEHIKEELYAFVEKFSIDIIVAQNSLTIPMNIPLGVALTNYIAETGIPTIAHHHDFYWERDRFRINSVGDMLSMAFPPVLESLQHVTINTPAQEDLCHRRGVSSILVPNVLDFETSPGDLESEEYNQDFRSNIGLTDDDILFLQPTRVVPRKGIEHAITLLAALKEPRCKLVISHESGDEGHEYMNALRENAEQSNVDLRFVDSVIGEKREVVDGRKVYTLADAYSQADFITYPSLYEGFGNALLEAFYYRKPVLVNRYSIYIHDIEPKGFKVVPMDGIITQKIVNQVRQVIEDDEYRRDMVTHNFELSTRWYSYSVLSRKLRTLVTNVTGLDSL